MKNPKMKRNWSKYNIKSPKVPHGKDGSEYYSYLKRAYKGKPKEVDRLWEKFHYGSTHGQHIELIEHI